MISFETNILVWLIFLSAIAFISWVVLRSKSHGRKFDFRLLAIGFSSLSVIGLFMIWQSGFLMLDQTSKNSASLTFEEFPCENVPEEGSQIVGVGGADMSPETEASYEAWISFVEHDLSSLRDLTTPPEPCETWELICDNWPIPPGYVRPSECKMKVSAAACAQCGFSAGESYTSEQIQNCAAGMTPEALGCDARISIQALCMFRHEAIHSGQDFSSMRSCETEIPAFEDTEQCFREWCERCPRKCSDSDRRNISFARAAVEFNQCVCRRSSIHHEAISDDILEIIQSTIHCSLCRLACGLSLRCAFFPGDNCQFLERAYCNDTPWHLEPQMGLQNSEP